MAGDAFLLALIITIEPLPIIGFILLLSAQHGTAKGAGYIAGWVISLAALIPATVLVAGGLPHYSSNLPPGASSAALFVFGVLLVLLGVRRRRHPKAPKSGTPRWANRIETIPVWGAAVIGFLLQPWPLVVAGAAKVASGHYSTGKETLLLIAFAAVSTASLAAMETYALASPEASERGLAALRAWIERHRRGTVTGLCFIVGVWLIIQSVYGFVT